MKRPFILLMHLFYWLVYFCLLSLFFGMSTMYQPRRAGQFGDWNELMLAFAIIPGALGFYGAYGILFRRLLVPRRILFLVLALAGLSLLSVIIGQFLLYHWFPSRINWTGETVISMGVTMAVNAALNGMAGLGLKTFITWYQELRWKEELSRKNHETEMALIRMQLSPHFLFNTINNIDTLIGQDPNKASDYLNKLSGIMRFMLYETKAALIPLGQELAYIGSYISLQQIRMANPDYVYYQVSGSAVGRQVPPMLFIPFIENAFKHSAPQKSGNAINITIAIEEDNILFECTNKPVAVAPFETEYGGLGNELICRRLELLYASRQQLEVTNETGIYKVKLRVPLSRMI